jgi:2,3-bisphosphoglycerate-independent phosphoglycerate mutase
MANLELMRRLSQGANTKIVLLVMDGLGGLPMAAGGLTELETAKTPTMDRLARDGCLGLSVPVALGVSPGSGPAHLALFGYDPVRFDIGRGVLEAFGIGVPVGAADVAARGNFCTVDADGNISDRRAGRIQSEAAEPIVRRLAQIRVPGVEVEVRHVKEYRFVVVFRGEKLSPEVEETDPQRVGFPPLPAQARIPLAERTADAVNNWVEQARKLLANEPLANCLTLRGFSGDPSLPKYRDVYKLRAACVAVYPMYKGVSQLVGMDVQEFRGDRPEDEFAQVKKVWDDYDFFFVHVKATDSRGEDGDFDGKVRVIESVDAALPALLDLRPDVVVITGDHSTPARLKTHTWHPVPTLIWAPATHLVDPCTEFGERACAMGGLGRFPATDIMPLAMGHAMRLERYGA